MGDREREREREQERRGEGREGEQEQGEKQRKRGRVKDSGMHTSELLKACRRLCRELHATGLHLKTFVCSSSLSLLSL